RRRPRHLVHLPARPAARRHPDRQRQPATRSLLQPGEFMRQNFTPPPNAPGNGNGQNKDDSYERTFEELSAELDAATQLPPAPPELFYGPLGQIALAIGEVTEFDPAGTYAALICCVGNALSRSAILRLGTHRFPPIDFVALVGETSDARKS